jgi:hypothetical protein
VAANARGKSGVIADGPTQGEENSRAREFVRLTAASLAGWAAGCSHSGNAGDDFDVIVVGAGIAGLSAGAKLKGTGLALESARGSRSHRRALLSTTTPFPLPSTTAAQFFHQVVAKGVPAEPTIRSTTCIARKGEWTLP